MSERTNQVESAPVASAAALVSEITPLILTYNEAPNLERTLRKLEWAQRVVIVDSFSTDETERIARNFANVIYVQRKFDTFAGQCNFGLEHVHTPWVLSIDADYVLTDELIAEIAELSESPHVNAYFARFRYCVFGRPLRGTLYPPRAVLFRKGTGHYVQDGHAHRLVFEGPSTFLRGRILHDDRKPLSRWLESQRSYARLEAQKLLKKPTGSAPVADSSLADRLRRWIWPAVPAAFFYTLFVKGCLLDGWAGWYYVSQRVYAELLLSLELLDSKLRGTENETDSFGSDREGDA